MAEYRKDPLVERWVIIAPSRSARPHEYVETETIRRGGRCSFCAGSEAETPHEIAALRDAGTAADGPGWRVRLVSNKYPFLDSLDRGSEGANERGSEEGTESKCQSLPLTLAPTFPPPQPALGFHEVLIESPRHVTRSGELSVAETADVLRLYRMRLAALRREAGIRYVQIFKNVGEAGGASLEHLHSQLAALTMVPDQVAAEQAAASEYFSRRQRCAFCELISAELAVGVRVVEASPSFAVLCPYASRFSYEMLLLPRQHAANFDELPDDELLELAAVLRRTLRRVESLANRAAYNVVLHVDSFDSSSGEHYHWHLEVLPRGAKQAGFEWATGVFINAVAPEAAAERLRHAVCDVVGDQTGVTRRGEFAD